MRSVVVFWMKETVEHGCAPGGELGKRDREAFEQDGLMPMRS